VTSVSNRRLEALRTSCLRCGGGEDNLSMVKMRLRRLGLRLDAGEVAGILSGCGGVFKIL